MPLWGSHIAIGAVGYQFGFKSNFNKWWKIVVLIAILTGLPDIVDFSLGFILADANSLYDYHYGITHTIYFAVIAGYFVSMGIPQKMNWLSWQSHWVNFVFCFLLISSHSLADFISNKQMALFFHPLGAALPDRDLGVMDFLGNFFSYKIRDVKIMAICVGFIVSIQLIKFMFKKRRIFRFAVWSNIIKK